MSKIVIDPKKELFKWGPIDFKFFYGSGILFIISKKIGESYPWPWPPALCICKNGRLLWINEKKALCQIGLRYFKRYFLDLNEHKRHWAKYQDWVLGHDSFAKKTDTINFKKLSNNELQDVYAEFVDLNKSFWLIVHVPEIANWGGEWLLKKELEKISRDNADKYLEILSASVKFSFFQQEELDLLRSNNLEKHAKDYCWLLNSYGGNRVLRTAYFKKRLKEIVRNQRIKKIEGIIKKHKARKRSLVKKLNLNPKTILISDQLSQAIWWQDHRKSYIWRMNYYWDKLLNEISKRKGWKIEDLQYCWWDDIENILKGKEISKEEVRKRKQYYAFYSSGDNPKFITDFEKVKRLFSIYEDYKEEGVKEIKGLTVSRGKSGILKGEVKIISNPFKEGKKMKAGDILVAGMTSPEYIVVMKKAKAIITDHGGMTSHAAIVSRELGIPFIVGTKIATKVLKDGDLVEVDADKGIIKIIQKNG